MLLRSIGEEGEEVEEGRGDKEASSKPRVRRRHKGFDAVKVFSTGGNLKCWAAGGPQCYSRGNKGRKGLQQLFDYPISKLSVGPP